MRKIYSITLGILVLLLMAASVSAQSASNNVEITKINWVATANWADENNKEYILFVNSTDDGITHIYMTISSNSNPYEFSSRYNTTDKIFTIDHNLGSASLSGVKLYNIFGTGTTNNVTIKADWIGTGDIKNYNDGTANSELSYVYRAATSTGSIKIDDGVTVNPWATSNAQLIKNLVEITKTGI